MSIGLKQAKQFYAARVAWLSEGGKPSEHAQVRAEVCLACPHNQPEKAERLKGAIAALVRRQIELKNEHMKLKVEGEERLHVCELCGCLLSLKVHVPLHVAREATPDWQGFPGHCWLRNDDLK